VGLVAWASTALVVSGEPVQAWVVAGSAVVLGGAAARRRWWFGVALAVVALACLLAGGARLAAREAGPLHSLARDGAVAVVEVRLDGGARVWEASGTRPPAWVGGGRLVRLEARGKAWASGARVEVLASGDDARVWADLPLGATVRVVGRLGPADADARAEAVVRAREPPELVRGPDAVATVVGRVRAGLRDACAGLGPDARGLVPALVVGDTSGLSGDLQEQFRVTGLTHLTAVSGANLTLLLVFLRTVALAVGVRGRRLTAVLVAGVAAFVALCLGEPSVVRAAAMGLVGLAALGRAGRGRQGLRFLGVAVLGVVVVDPWMARSVGFALSVLASVGLLWWAGDWADRLARWLPRWAAEALAVPLAAQVATEPVVVALSGQVSVVGVLANVVAGPLVGPATVLGLAAALVAPRWLAPAVALAWLAGVCAQAIAWVARLGAALPGAAVPWPATPATVLLVAAGCLVGSVLVPWLLVRPLACGLLALAVLASLARAPHPPRWPPDAWSVAFCDVGQGDATLVRAGPGAAVLVDAGPDPRLLLRCLDQLRVASVPFVAFTHLHADHTAGATALSGRGTSTVLTSAVRTPASGAAVVAAVSGERVEADPGSAWQVGDARIEVLAAPARPALDLAAEGESSAENDASLLLRATSGGVSVLLAGDAEEAGQSAHLALAGRLDVDVLLVPHHGSARRSQPFLAASRPSLAVVSVGLDNDYGHPAAGTLRDVAATGATLVRTDERGAVAVARVDGSLVVTTQR